MANRTGRAKAPPRPQTRVDGPTARQHLRALSDDLAYLLVKDQLGEILTDAERRRVEAWREVARAQGPGGRP
jgi:hypothetical protein